MFDVGGVVEMVDYKMHGDVVIAEPSMPALRDKIVGANNGLFHEIRILVLSAVTSKRPPKELMQANGAQTCCMRERSGRCSLASAL